MKIEHQYRHDCDTLRFLVTEFENLYLRYVEENREDLSRTEVHDVSTYQPPRCISNLRELLTSSLLVEIQGLLDFSLPKVVKHLARSKNITITSFDKQWNKGSVLDWVKHVLKKEVKSVFNFSCGPYSRLKVFYKIRHDQVHHGGYLSEEKRRDIVNRMCSVCVSRYTNLYDIEFSYCRKVIDDAEAFMIQVEKSISNQRIVKCI